MPRPESYRVQEVIKMCGACNHVDALNHQLYFRKGEPKSIMTLLLTEKMSEVREKIEPTQVDEYGVCDEFEQIPGGDPE